MSIYMSRMETIKVPMAAMIWLTVRLEMNSADGDHGAAVQQGADIVADDLTPGGGWRRSSWPTAGSRPRVEATKNTKKQARNLPITMEVTPTGAVSRAWSVLFFWSSDMLFMVMMGMIIMPKENMVLYTGGDIAGHADVHHLEIVETIQGGQRRDAHIPYGGS